MTNLVFFIRQPLFFIKAHSCPKSVSATRQGNGMFPKRRILGLEQESERAKIRSERSHGRRSERSRGNMPLPCL
ncbi:MAG: hypothetical protein DRG63_11380 [Deltaproteobacteria bacterium]|nr:MAG: hypothetical protein DRG63_11380 [Deltaproteobacteria bacterium]